MSRRHRSIASVSMEKPIVRWSVFDFSRFSDWIFFFCFEHEKNRLKRQNTAINFFFITFPNYFLTELLDIQSAKLQTFA